MKVMQQILTCVGMNAIFKDFLVLQSVNVLKISPENLKCIGINERYEASLEVRGNKYL